jgi:hypothetical protein
MSDPSASTSSKKKKEMEIGEPSYMAERSLIHLKENPGTFAVRLSTNTEN